MPVGTDILNLVIKADASGAVKEFSKLGKGIDDAGDKAASGFKGKLTQGFDTLQQKSGIAASAFKTIGISSQQAASVIATALPAAGLAAGAAIGKFALDGVSNFSKLGLSVEKFAQSSGLSLDQASRWTEVANDLGISTETVSTAFVKMEKSISTNRAAFGDLVKVGKSGGVDLTATFLAVSEHLKGIKDPIDRAAESSKLFGKGFSQVSQLLGMDAADIKKRLEGVADVKVFTPDKIAQVHKYRDAMNDFHDSIEEAQLALAQHLLPQIAKVAAFAAKAIQITVEIGTTGTGIGDEFDISAAAAKGDEAAQEFNATLDKAIAKSGKLNETAKAALGVTQFDVLKTKVQDLGTALGPAGTSIGDFGRTASEHFRGAAVGVDLLTTSVSKMGTAIGPASTAFGDLTRSAASVVTSQDMFAGSADSVANSLAREGSELADVAAKQDALTASVLAATDASFAQHKLTLDVVNAQNDLTKAQQEGTATALELQVKQDDVVSSAIQLAAKNKEVETTAHGAESGNKAFIDTLTYIANTSSPEVKAQLDGVIAKLKDTGSQHPNPTVSVNDQASGPLSSIKGKVDGLDGARASIHVTADTSAARSAVNGIIAGFNRLPGTHIAQIATGTKNFAGGLALVGERGPELVMLPSGTMVKNAAETKAMMDGPSALPMSTTTNNGGSVNIVFSGLVTDEIAVGREIKRVLARAGYSGVS